MNKKCPLIQLAWFSLLMIILPLVSLAAPWANDSIHANFTVYQCDSLIQANTNNPDFVVMDVRTPAEHNPAHLAGAINRNFYDPDFSTMISQLPKNKLYLIYCGSGGRSGQTFTLMTSMGFPCIVNMISGMAAWNAASLPSTASFAPLQMAVSDTIIPDDTLYIGTPDTLSLTVTNRANDTLKFTGITALSGTEFSTDFDTSVMLTGPFDYSFHIIYLPTDTITDSLTFRIASNGGAVQFHIRRTGKELPVGIADNNTGNIAIKSYPNPFLSSTCIEYELGYEGPVTITITDALGRTKDEYIRKGKMGLNRMILAGGDFTAGIYFCRIATINGNACFKIMKR